jgi:hypothetical protein
LRGRRTSYLLQPGAPRSWVHSFVLGRVSILGWQVTGRGETCRAINYKRYREELNKRCGRRLFLAVAGGRGHERAESRGHRSGFGNLNLILHASAGWAFGGKRPTGPTADGWSRLVWFGLVWFGLVLFAQVLPRCSLDDSRSGLRCNWCVICSRPETPVPDVLENFWRRGCTGAGSWLLAPGVWLSLLVSCALSQKVQRPGPTPICCAGTCSHAVAPVPPQQSKTDFGSASPTSHSACGAWSTRPPRWCCRGTGAAPLGLEEER